MVSLVQIIPILEKADMKHPPLGLLYLGGSLRKANFPVKIFHILPTEINKSALEIINQKPLFVGFSVMTGIPAYYAVQMSKLIKKLDPKIPIIWGGHHPTLTAKECLNEDYIDIVVRGEGEETIVELANALKEGKDLKSILGIGYKKNGKVIINPSRPRIKNLDNLIVDWSLANVSDYIISSGNEKVIGFYSSRGCPYNCGFCSSAKFFERTWRAHSSDYVVNSLKQLKEKYGINGVFFADDNFIIDRKRAFEIIKGLYNIGIRTKTLDIRINHLDEEILYLLRETKATGIFIGWESGCDRLLKLMNKGITRNEIIEKVKLLAKYPEISVWASGIVGFPTETKEERKQTIETGLEMFKIHPNIVVSYQIYLPFPGTDLLPLAVKMGFKMPEKMEDWRNIDIQGQTKNMPWLPWLNKREQAKLWMTNRYSKIMLRKYYSVNWLIKFIGNFFTFLAEQRIKNQNFIFPIDLALYKFLKKCKQTIKS